MRNHIFLCLLLSFSCLCAGNFSASAQEAQENIDAANTYFDHRVNALGKSLDVTDKLQQKLLKRLQKKEDKMLRKLAKQDSALYKQYVSQHLNYDSIAALSNDTSKRPNALSSNKTIDSLKGIQRFIQNQASKLGTASSALGGAGVNIPGSESFLALQQKLNSQISTDQLIQQHTNDLNQLAGGANISGLQNIQKDVYYARAKMQVYKEMADEPDAAEKKALEYLQGVDGFDKYLNQSNPAFGGLGNNATEADLQGMGYQTKSSVSAAIQNQLGNNMNAIQQQMSQQIQQYSEKLNDVKKQIDAAKTEVSQAKQSVNEAKTEVKEAKNSLKNIDKPDFKVNKEKGKPFWERFEKQITFQTSRASVDGLKPAMINIGASAGYKQTEKLSFGIGLAFNTGLGQNWQHLKVTYEGISLRAYADWLFIYGFSFQVGYEKVFIPSSRAYLTNSTDHNNNSNPSSPSVDNLLDTAFGGQQETAYLGIMKRYKISGKWNGTFLIGYNVLSQNTESRSPWVIRLGWSK